MAWYEAVFGQQMWRNVILGVTFWTHSQTESKLRLHKRKTNETTFANDLKVSLYSIYKKMKRNLCYEGCDK
jgi:hypothetical protein